jgi:hypothetical protein
VPTDFQNRSMEENTGNERKRRRIHGMSLGTNFGAADMSHHCQVVRIQAEKVNARVWKHKERKKKVGDYGVLQS